MIRNIIYKSVFIVQRFISKVSLLFNGAGAGRRAHTDVRLDAIMMLGALLPKHQRDQDFFDVFAGVQRRIAVMLTHASIHLRGFEPFFTGLAEILVQNGTRRNGITGGIGTANKYQDICLTEIAGERFTHEFATPSIDNTAAI